MRSAEHDAGCPGACRQTRLLLIFSVLQQPLTSIIPRNMSGVT